MANTLVTVALAKSHLRITDNDHDTEVETKADHAAAVITDYVAKGRTRYPEPFPDPASAEWLIAQSAALDLLACLYEHRGDDLGINAPDAEVWNAIRRKLSRMRDPALA